MKTKEEIRQRIKARIRKKLSGTPERPRLAVFRSQSHIYAQVIDDDAGRTLCQASSLDGELKARPSGAATWPRPRPWASSWPRGPRRRASTAVVFDRGGFQYHGRVKALADAAREAGLKF